MVITLPGNPWAYRTNLSTSITGVTGTIAADAGSGRAYLLHGVITFDASAAGKWWIWQGTTATIMVGPFYPTTCDSWVLAFGPRGYPGTATSLDIGWAVSASGLFSFNLDGYTV
jgi:hypothetical protein